MNNLINVIGLIFMGGFVLYSYKVTLHTKKVCKVKNKVVNAISYVPIINAPVVLGAILIDMKKEQ